MGGPLTFNALLAVWRYLYEAHDAHKDALVWHASAPSERLVYTSTGELVARTRHDAPTGYTVVTRADGYRMTVATGWLARPQPQ